MFCNEIRIPDITPKFFQVLRVNVFEVLLYKLFSFSSDLGLKQCWTYLLN